LDTRCTSWQESMIWCDRLCSSTSGADCSRGRALIGHEAYLTEAYRRHSEEDLAKFYREAEFPMLLKRFREAIASIHVNVHVHDPPKVFIAQTGSGLTSRFLAGGIVGYD
jgi:hypothetical protein